MPIRNKTLKLCNCNGTLPMDGAVLSGMLGLGAALPVAGALCRKDVGSFTAALKGSRDIVVACTQEAPRFGELAEESGFSGRLQFVNLREQAGWSAEGRQAQPKMAALLAMAGVPDPEPVRSVSFESRGALLIIGPSEAALSWAEQLMEKLEVSVLLTSARHGCFPARRDYPVFSGSRISVTGFLGEFDVSWKQENPIDLELCTRCNACIAACPEGAIGPVYQIDAEKCRGHRACVEACGTVAAIDFKRTDSGRKESFDLVLDLSATPLIRLPHPPQGYLSPGRDPLDQAKAALEISALVGEFEKPHYAEIHGNRCAHIRNRIVGCTRCIDVCSSGAIRSAPDAAEIDPYLCRGCGGCHTVCPTGAVRYQYPKPADIGLRARVALRAYAAAGGKQGCLLLHDARDGWKALMHLGQQGAGLPARVIPLEVHDVAATGLDVLLGAVAFGASQCVIAYSPAEPESYVDALRRQMEFGETILNALGYAGTHFILAEADEHAALHDAVWNLKPAETVREAAVFNLPDDKRRAIEFSLEHLSQQAPQPQKTIPLAAGAPFGAVRLDQAKCTLCMACAGACPSSALMDTPELPRLRFIERNCVQCGLCVKTCPENALALEPRLLLGAGSRRESVLKEAEPANCVRCGKAFATRQMVETMVARLSGHSMFSGKETLQRLHMCAECRVVDMLEGKSREMTIHDL